MQPQATRHAYLDSLRAFAATAVVFSHTAGDVIPGFKTFSLHTFGIGQVGVVLLVMLCGVLCPPSLIRHSATTFLRQRASRILPLYILTIALFSAMAMAGVVSAPQLEHASPKAWIANLTGTQIFLKELPFLGYHHTMSLFVCLYLLFALLATSKLLGNIQKLAWMNVGLLVGAAGLCVSTGKLPSTLHIAIGFGLVGAAYATADRRKSGQMLALSLATVFAIGLALFAAEMRTTVFEAADRHALSNFLSHLVAAALFHVVWSRSETLKFPTAFQTIGRNGYGIYLFHPFVLMTPLLLLPAVLAIPLVVTGSVLVAMAAHRFIDAPVATWLATPTMPLFLMGRGVQLRAWYYAPSMSRMASPTR